MDFYIIHAYMRTNLVVIKTFRLAQGLPTWGTFAYLKGHIKVSNRRKIYLDLIYFKIYIRISVNIVLKNHHVAVY